MLLFCVFSAFYVYSSVKLLCSVDRDMTDIAHKKMIDLVMRWLKR